MSTQSRAMEMFHFNEEDLAANRTGRLSDRQKRRFKTNRDVGLVVWVLVGAFWTVRLLAPSGSASTGPLVDGWTVAGLDLAWALIAVALFWMGTRVFLHGTVDSVTGTVTFQLGGVAASMDVGEMRFRFIGWYKTVFVPGALYTIYYVRFDKTIVAVEEQSARMKAEG